MRGTSHPGGARMRAWSAIALICVVIAVLIALPVPVVAAESENLLNNPSFLGAETKLPPAGWLLYGQSTVGGNSISVVDADHPDKRALRIVDAVAISRGSAGETGVTQTVPGKAGLTYRATAWVKAVPDATTDGAFLQLRFLPSNKLSQVEMITWDTADFTPFSVEAIAPEGTTNARIYVWTSASKTPTILLRNVELKSVEPKKEVVWTVEQVKQGLANSVGTPQPGQVIPKIGLYITAEDILRAREWVAKSDWGRELQRKLLDEASFWASMPDEWYRGLMPQPGAIFSYGETGCPIDGSSWPRFGGGGTADFSRPKTLRCSNGRTIYFDDPESPYYDSGKGITINGVLYQLQGVWNSYVTNQLAGIGGDAILHKLAYAYALTGDEKYANKCIFIMDLLATLSPTTIGPRDFTTSDTAVQGRLHWYTSIVHRAKMKLMGAYDLVYHVPKMHEPSPSQEGLSIAENIEQNLIKDYLFEEFDPRGGKLKTLHNHEADSVRAMLGAGLVLGNPEWIRWGLEGLGYFLDNTINRDGMYYETSPGYSEFSRSVFLDMVELAYNYRPETYATSSAPEEFPLRQEFPYELNYYDHPGLRNFVFGYRDRIDAGGHRPAYGNSTMPLNQARVGSVDLPTWQAVLRFRERSSQPDWKQEFESWLVQTQDDTSAARYDLWALFHSEPLQADSAPGVTHNPYMGQSNILPAAALSVLRSEVDHTRAVEMRGGTTLPHGHDDVLGFNLYANGYHLTHDIGYGLSGSPVHLGWGTRSVAHNLVVVNEAAHRNGAYHQLGPGASITAFHNGGLVDVVEMDAAKHYQPEDQLETYRRSIIQVETAQGPYYVDLFRVNGGQIHDYVFHGRSSEVVYQGLSVAPHPTTWTLAGLSHPDASYNAPGRSWGERIIPGEFLKDLGIPGEEVGGRHWTPPPGNGYGFIHNLRQGQPSSEVWQAVWPANVGMKVRMTSLTAGPAKDGVSDQFYDGLAPDLLGRNRLRYVIERKRSTDGRELDSMYVHLFEAYSSNPVVHSAKRLPLQQESVGALALEVTRHAGQAQDYILYGGPEECTVTTEHMQWQGHTAVLHVVDEQIKRLSMVGGRKLDAYGWVIESDPMWSGQLTAVNPAGRYVEVDASLPAGDVLAELLMIVDHPDYQRNSAYVLREAEPHARGTRVDLGDITFDLARARVERIAPDGRLASKSPLPTGHAYGVSTDYLAGRELVVEPSGIQLQVRKVPEFSLIQLVEPPVAGTVGPDDAFVIRDIKVGDTFAIRNVVELESLNDDEWEVRISARTRIQMPFPIRQVLIQVRDQQVVVPADHNTFVLDPQSIGSGRFVMVIQR